MADIWRERASTLSVDVYKRQGVVFADTGHGYVRRDGEACISSRSDRIPDRYCFFVVHR